MKYPLLLLLLLMVPAFAQQPAEFINTMEDAVIPEELSRNFGGNGRLKFSASAPSFRIRETENDLRIVSGSSSSDEIHRKPLIRVASVVGFWQSLRPAGGYESIHGSQNIPQQTSKPPQKMHPPTLWKPLIAYALPDPRPRPSTQLPLLQNYDKKLLILDMDELMIYRKKYNNDPATRSFFQKANYIAKSFEGTYAVMVRPHLFEFIRWAKQFYDIAVWTAGTKVYADSVLVGLDPMNQLFSFRLYRDSCGFTRSGGMRTKDLSTLGFDMRNVVALDDNKYSFYDNTVRIGKFMYFTNGIVVPEFNEETPVNGDDQLRPGSELAKFLEMISSARDVRVPIIQRQHAKGELMMSI